METSSAIFYGEDLIDGKRTKRLQNIVLHEIAHQWFGNAVTEMAWDDAWLSEGFATYFTMLFIEHAYGREELLEQLSSAKQKVYEYALKDPTYKIIDNRSPEKGPVTNILTYQKGAWILHMLRNEIGDLAFKNGIRDYYRSFMNSNAATNDFRLAMERASGKELQLFFNQWLYQGGNLMLHGNWRYDKVKKLVEVTLEQTQPVEFIFHVDVELSVTVSGKPVETTLHKLDSRTATFTIPCKTKPEKVLLDPNSKLLAMSQFSENK
jgi:aminopeptidase N